MLYNMINNMLYKFIGNNSLEGNIFWKNNSERKSKEFKKEVTNVKIKTDRSNLKCPFCGSQHVYIHSCKNILLKNHVFDDKIQYLDVKFKRFICSECHKNFSENIENRYKKTKITNDLAFDIFNDFSKTLLIKDIENKYDIHFNLAKDIISTFCDLKNEKDREILIKNGINTICVDEKCVGKYDFYTIFRDYKTRKVIYFTQGKSSEAIKKFKESFDENITKNFKNMCIDKSKAFLHGISHYFPDVNITFDKFHVMQNLNENYFKKCYNREKNRILNSIKEIKGIIKKNKNVENNKILKEMFYGFIKDYKLLIENRENFKRKNSNLNTDNLNNLDKICGFCEELKEFRIFKDNFTELLETKDLKNVKNNMFELFENIKFSKVKELKRFYKNNVKYIDFFCNIAIYKVSNAAMESLNRNIKMIYNRGRGYKDKDFFFKIVSCFT